MSRTRDTDHVYSDVSIGCQRSVDGSESQAAHGALAAPVC